MCNLSLKIFYGKKSKLYTYAIFKGDKFSAEGLFQRGSWKVFETDVNFYVNNATKLLFKT